MLPGVACVPPQHLTTRLLMAAAAPYAWLGSRGNPGPAAAGAVPCMCPASCWPSLNLAPLACWHISHWARTLHPPRLQRSCHTPSAGYATLRPPTPSATCWPRSFKCQWQQIQAPACGWCPTAPQQYSVATRLPAAVPLSLAAQCWLARSPQGVLGLSLATTIKICAEQVK